MKKNYFMKSLMGLAMLCGITTANAQTIQEVAGKYSDGENTLTVRVDDAEAGTVLLSGFMGKGCTVNGTYADGAITINASKGVYVDMGVSLEAGALAAMQLLVTAEADGSVNMVTGMAPIVLKVDGQSLSYDVNLACAVMDFMTGGMTPVAYMAPASLKKQEVPVLTAEQIVGEYTFTANSAETNDEFKSVLGESLVSDNYTLTVAPGAGENQFTVSGFFGYSMPVQAEYVPATGQLIVSTDIQAGMSAIVGETATGDALSLTTLMTNTYFDVTADGMSTNNTIILSFKAGADSDYDDGIAALVRGGKAVKGADAIHEIAESQSDKVEYYTLGGVRVNKVQNMPKGAYIVKSAKGSKKVIF